MTLYRFNQLGWEQPLAKLRFGAYTPSAGSGSVYIDLTQVVCAEPLAGSENPWRGFFDPMDIRKAHLLHLLDGSIVGVSVEEEQLRAALLEAGVKFKDPWQSLMDEKRKETA